MNVVVVGAGISGLAAAWELAQAGCDVTVLESERRAGGVVVTEQVQGCVVEGGPDGFLASETELPALAEALGIGDQVVSQQARGTALWTGQALEPIEEGRAAMLLGIDATSTEVSKGFRSFAAGMGQLVGTLAERVARSIRFAQGVAGLVAVGKGWRVAVTGGSAHDADAVVLALPAYAAGRLLEAVGVAHARVLAEVMYLPSVTVSLAYRAEQIGQPLAGSGFVAQSGPVRACTYTSQKFPGRAPRGQALLRAFVPPLDGDPAAVAHAQLALILGIRGEPLWSRAFTYDHGLPRYRSGHADHVAAVRRRMRRLPPLAIAGAGYDGAGMSACVRSGRNAGKELLSRLGS